MQIAPSPVPASLPSIAAPVPTPGQHVAGEAFGGVVPGFVSIPPSLVDVLPKLPLPGPGDKGLRVLPAPPKPGSTVQNAELKLMHVIQDHRTAEGDAWARQFSDRAGLNTWMMAVKELGQRRGHWVEVKAAALVSAALGATFVASAQQKHRFQRQRPFQQDPTITTVVKRPHDSSYPSGHASTGFAAARILSRIDPDHTADYYSLASQEALARVYGGVHFPSDVVAGALLGTAIGEVLVKSGAGTAPAA